MKTELLQVNFTGLLQLVNKLQPTCPFYQVTTSLLNQACRNFWLQLLKTTCSNPVDNNGHSKAGLNRVVNKLTQAMRTHPDIGLLITNLLQDVNRLAITWAFLAVQKLLNSG